VSPMTTASNLENFFKIIDPIKEEQTTAGRNKLKSKTSVKKPRTNE
jgi:hypothetical protein